MPHFLPLQQNNITLLVTLKPNTSPPHPEDLRKKKRFFLVSSYCYSILQNEKVKEKKCDSRKHFDHGFFSIEDLTVNWSF